MFRWTALSVMLALGLVSAACGGGGGGGSSGSTGAGSASAGGGALALQTASCPAGVQGSAYAGCALTATGGSPPYRFSVSPSTSYSDLPPGLVLNASTGVISSTSIGGQGASTVMLIATDAVGATASRTINFSLQGSNAYLATIFPATSIFHHRVDSLPVDTSPAAPIYSGYQSARLRVFFGNAANLPLPDGIPVIEVPASQANVPVATTLYQSYFTSGPIPSNAPVEQGYQVRNNGDQHVLIYQDAGATTPPKLFEMWTASYLGAAGWTDYSNAMWPDLTSNALPFPGSGTADAAGLPIAPLLVNADEVIGSGTSAAPNGAVQHPIRFTLNNTLNYWVWPGTASAGVGSCSDAGGALYNTRTRLPQDAPPATCSMTGPMGEIYRLKASAPTPACAASSPQAAIIITAMRRYGIILADNGLSGGLIGTPDTRWNDRDLACLTSIALSSFEPVNVSGLMTVNGSATGLTAN